MHEVIAGGTVVVGKSASDVSGGTVRRDVLKCPQPIDLSHVQVGSAVTAPKLLFRGNRKTQPASVIFFTSPVLAFKTPREVTDELVDRGAKTHRKGRE